MDVISADLKIAVCPSCSYERLYRVVDSKVLPLNKETNPTEREVSSILLEDTVPTSAERKSVVVESASWVENDFADKLAKFFDAENELLGFAVVDSNTANTLRIKFGSLPQGIDHFRVVTPSDFSVSLETIKTTLWDNNKLVCQCGEVIEINVV